jgi:hypothetical protein
MPVMAMTPMMTSSEPVEYTGGRPKKKVFKLRLSSAATDDMTFSFLLCMYRLENGLCQNSYRNGAGLALRSHRICANIYSPVKAVK